MITLAGSCSSWRRSIRPIRFVTQQTVQTGTADPDVVTNFTYTNRGELWTATDADGRSTKYTYDGMSRPLTKVVKDEHGATLGTWTTTYTGAGDVDTVVGPRTGTTDSVKRTYDSAGRPPRLAQ